LNTGNNNPMLDGANVTKVDDNGSSALDIPALPDNVSDAKEPESASQPEGVENEDPLDGSGGASLRIKRQDDSDDLLPDEQNGNTTITEQIIEGPSREVKDFSFGFGYGCALVSAILILVGVLIIIFDQKHEEIYYKEVSIAISEMQDVKE